MTDATPLTQAQKALQAKTQAAVEARVKAKDKASEGLSSLLSSAYAEMVKTLRALAADPLMAPRLPTMRLDDLRVLLDTSGIQALHDHAMESYSSILIQNIDGVELIHDAQGQVRVDTAALEALMERQWEALWETKVMAPALAAIAQGLSAMATGAFFTAAITTIATSLDKAAVRAGEAAKSDLGVFDRASAEAVAQASGLDYRVYLGPPDTGRAFCRALVGKVVSLSQLDRLRNGNKGGSSVSYQGGGPGCRHAWVPISKEQAIAAGYPFATGEDVEQANA